MKEAPREATGTAFLRRLILPPLIGLSVYFALFGGEYSVFEVRRVRAENLELEQRLTELKWANDSLRTWAEALETEIISADSMQFYRGMEIGGGRT